MRLCLQVRLQVRLEQGLLKLGETLPLELYLLLLLVLVLPLLRPDMMLQLLELLSLLQLELLLLL